MQNTHISRKHVRALKRLMEHFSSQKQIADTLNLSAQAVNDWFKKRKPIPLKQALRLSRMLQGRISVEEFRPDLFPEDSLTAEE